MAVAALGDYGMSKVHRSTLVESAKVVKLRCHLDCLNAGVGADIAVGTPSQPSTGDFLLLHFVET